ncbi:hypothetical protein ACQJBY_019563 [Aegilops geniculata]
MDGGADSTRSSVADSTRAMEGSAAPNSSRGKRCGIGASAEERRRGLLASVGWAYREPHRVAKFSSDRKSNSAGPAGKQAWIH